MVKGTAIDIESNTILQMPLSIHPIPDKKVCKCSNPVTVQSAYHLAINSYSSLSHDRASSSYVDTSWKNIWKVGAIPKIQHFLWRALHDSLPTKTNLAKRKCADDPICLMCGEHPESLQHPLLECSETQKIWRFDPLRIQLQSSVQLVLGASETFSGLFFLKQNQIPSSFS